VTIANIATSGAPRARSGQSGSTREPRDIDAVLLDLEGTLIAPGTSAEARPARGAFKLLALLHRLDLPWAVVTGADRRLAWARLEGAHIEAPVLVTAEDCLHAKPSPDGYLTAAARLGVHPTRCLVVEDTAQGIEAGLRAGATVAALRDSIPSEGGTAPALDGHIAVTDLADLADLLRDAQARRT
jgi:beta-phosphoglucomutase-like phosphatase (HAD superfamily)